VGGIGGCGEREDLMRYGRRRGLVSESPVRFFIIWFIR